MIHLYYGDGKGKTTAAVGLIIRALPLNRKIIIFKFFKTKSASGEDVFLLKQKNIKMVFSRFTFPFKQSISDDKIKQIYQHQKEIFSSVFFYLKKGYKFIILDEVLDLIQHQIITSDDCLALIKQTDHDQELIMTGHYIDEKLIQAADLVTEMKKVKHYFDRKTAARKGVEF